MIENVLIFGTFTGIIVVLSILLDKKKTVAGIRKGAKMFFNILHPFLNILILISFVLFFIPDRLVIEYLGSGSGWSGFVIAAAIGSIVLIPGFISYPLAATLLKQGATYPVVAVFMTTLMMVGVVTLPLEIKYFGKKVAIIRNLLNFAAALAVGFLVGCLM